MSTHEKLDAIREKCLDNITLAEGLMPRAGGVYLADLKYSVAGWRSTISAIDGLRKIAFIEETGATDESYLGRIAASALDGIITAWKGIV